jgi:CheY-like chemotaxis protein
MRRALIADDEHVIRHLLEELCLASGFLVDTVCDGRAAWVLMSGMNGSYDVVFMDLQMPGWDGLDALETYHGHGKHVIIVSGYLDSDLEEYLEAHPHVRSVLKKPFTTKSVSALLHAVIVEKLIPQEEPISPLHPPES